MSQPSDELREIYERRGELEYATPPGAPSPYDRRLKRLSAAISARLPCDAFLDAGCGDGRYLARLPSLGPVPERVVGLDIADSILRTAKLTTEAAGLEVELVRGNLEAIPLDDAAFDLVLCAQAIEHVLDPVQVLTELHRVLRPGRTLLLSTDNSAARVSKVLNAPRTTVVRLLGLRGRRLKVHFPHRSFHRAELEALLRAAGFEILSTETFRFHIDGSPWAVQRVLNSIDEALPPHPVGDILFFEARA